MTEKNRTTKPPVVAVMGHIDHGKSTLLDYIRQSNVVAKEAGGITQCLSAYEVVHKGEAGIERTITFLDTPGHEAFRSMRFRGAAVADVAVLVVSAEDGVKPQTLEALKAIKESNTPYVVAMTKIDKPNANIERTKQTLAEHEIYIEGYGGDVPAVPVSGKTGEGIPALLDIILLLSDLHELSYNKALRGEGVVIESHLDPKKGVSATLIIKDGSLSMGMHVVAGESVAPVRIMENFLGKTIKLAFAGSPVKIIGWSSLPPIGSVFTSYENKKQAEIVAEEYREHAAKAEPIEATPEGAAVIPVVIKTDAVGTIDAIIHEIKKIKVDDVHFKIIQTGAGTITENDVKLASGTSGSLVVGFNNKADARAIDLGERLGIEIKTFDVIYALTDWLLEIAKARKPKKEIEKIDGSLKVLKVFGGEKDKQVVGGRVTAGVLLSGNNCKIIRREAEVGRGKIVELQQQKVKVREVSEGTECGLLIESKLEIAAGDTLEAFSVVTE